MLQREVRWPRQIGARIGQAWICNHDNWRQRGLYYFGCQLHDCL